jgi:hypothetical protein
VGGVRTDGPPVGLKSLVTFKVMVPLPAVFVVRILKVKLVVPEKFRLKVVPAADSVVVDVFIWIAASGAIVADKVVLPVEAPNWPTPAASSREAGRSFAGGGDVEVYSFFS